MVPKNRTAFTHMFKFRLKVITGDQGLRQTHPPYTVSKKCVMRPRNLQEDSLFFIVNALRRVASVIKSSTSITLFCVGIISVIGLISHATSFIFKGL
jgi:hypothetical protein